MKIVGPVFHSCCPKSAQETTFYFPASSQQQAESIIDGFPLFLRQCLRINPKKVCRSALIALVEGGTFDNDTYTYTAPGNNNNILEFIDVTPPAASENLISTVELNAMARDEDEMTAETNLRNDDVSALSGGTENTVTLRAENKAMRETAALQAQCVRDLEAALATAQAANQSTPATSKSSSKAEEITPGEEDNGHTEEVEDEENSQQYDYSEEEDESEEEEEDEESDEEEDPFVDASEVADTEETLAEEQDAIELSGDEESSEEDYVPPVPQSPPPCRSTASSKRTSSQRSPKSNAAVTSRCTSRRRNGAAPNYHE